MRTQTSHFLIGSFVLSGTAILILALIALGASTPKREVVLGETIFEESVAGLEKGAAVRFRGVKMGEVDIVSVAGVLYDTQQTSVVVRWHVAPLPEARYGAAELREIIRKRVQQGMRCRLASSGLTGLTYLDADIFPDTERYPVKKRDWIKEGAEERFVYVPSIPSQLTRLADSLEVLLGNASKADLATLVTESSTTIRELGVSLSRANVSEVREAALTMLNNGGKVLQDLDGQLPRLIDSLDRAAGRIDGVAARLDTVLADPKLQGILQNVQSLSDDLRPVVGDARAVLKQGQSVLDGRSRDLAVIFDNLRAASDHLRNLLETADRYPSYLLFGNPPQPLRSPR